MAFRRLYNVSYEDFHKVCDRVIACVTKHEKRRGKRHYEDCTVLEDDLGPSQILFYVKSLSVLTPRLVADLKRTMKAHPHWEVVAIICSPEGPAKWPEMGLYIRGHEVIDALQRQYFPREFQSLRFADARPGTADD